MEQKAIAVSSFSNGLVTDTHPLYQQEGTYTYLLNGRKLTEDHMAFGVSNALSNHEFAKGLGTIVGATLIEERNQWLVFSQENSTVYLVHTETGEVTTVISLASCGIDFSSCEWLYAEMKTMQPCSELFVYFSSKCTYYVLNIDALLDPKRKDEFTCDDYLLFKCVCVPELQTEISSAAGGNLLAGAYRFVVQLEDEDGNTTNWFNVSYPISVESENNIGGEMSRKTIRITLDNLDTRYHKLNLAVIKNIAGVETYETFPSFYYSGSSFTYEYYGQQGEGIQLEELLTKRRTYIKGKDLIQKDNQLLLYNILQRRNLDYQRRANGIKVKGVVYVSKAEDAHRYRTMIRGERYLPAIGWNHCSGEKTNAFVLSNYGGFSGVDLDGDGNVTPAQIVPRSTDASPGTVTRNEVTLEGSRAGDTDSPSTANGTGEEAYDQVAENIDGLPDSEVDPCVGCGTDQTQGVVDFGNSFGVTNIDFITNSIRETRIRRRDRIRSGNIKQSIQNLLDEVKSLNEDEEENKEVYDVVDYTPVTREVFDRTNLETLLADKDLAKLTEFDFKVFESTDVYPLTKDCMGEYIYGDLAGQPIRLLEVPNDAEIPFYVSYQDGVKSQKTLGVDEFEDAYAFFIGLKLEDVPFPVDDELHTPLCEDNPYTIYMAETSPVNRRIVAKGIMPHTFSGEINGKEYAFPKHGVNSIEHVDRHIQNGTDTNHMGAPHDRPLFTFHSPDTSVGKPLLNVDNVFIPGDVFGRGYMHGQYAYGEEPLSAFFGRQKDQRGTRQSVNLNKTNWEGTAEIPISGITFAKGNKVITNANGIDMGLCNLYRESSVYMQLESMPPPLGQGVQNGYADYSFIGRGLNHSCQLPYAAAHYGVLRNEIPNQYGSVESLVYIDTGLSADGRQTTIEGLVGDGYIGPWTLKRTSYVSNKVGDNPINPSRRRVSGILQFFGFGDCTRPPDSGDDRDNKNLANLHPGQRCGDGLPTAPETDLYFPRTLNTMVAFWVESRVNVWYRATGVETGQVFYPKLKDLFLDSSVPNGSPWTESWLNRFHCLVNRASKFLIMLRAAIRLIAFFYGLYLVVDSILSINSLPDVFTTIVRAVLITALWAFLFFFVLTVRNLNKLLGLDECLDDRQGAYDHEQIRGWEDNYFDYNSDYSLPNRYNFAIGVPDPYNVCDCDDCVQNQVTHEIFLSNPQVVGSPIDSYKNYQANSYMTFPLNEGKITKMFIFNDQLMAHTTDSLKVVSYKGVDIRLNEDSSLQFKGLDVGGNRNIFISGGFLERANGLGLAAPEGIFGLQNYGHSALFPFGYVFIDEKANKVWLMESTSSIRELTNQGNKAFFRQSLGICNRGACHGEGMRGETGYTFGYDPLEELLYITKKDGANSFTMSYDLERKGWFGYHSFVPQIYLNTRKNFYSVKGGDIWVHNTSPCTHQTYYGEFYPHVLEYVSKDNIFMTPELDHFTFYTQANECSGANRTTLYNLKETFNKGIFYNNTQCSGELLFDFQADSLGNRDNLLDSIKDKGPVVPLVWQGEEWRVNRIRDLVVNHEVPIWFYGDDCSIDRVLNTSNLSFDKRPQDMNTIYDRFLKVRLTYDKPSAQNTQLVTHFTTVLQNNEIQ